MRCDKRLSVLKLQQGDYTGYRKVLEANRHEWRVVDEMAKVAALALVLPSATDLTPALLR